MDSTVAVASRSAYSARSAGARCGLCPARTSPAWPSTRSNARGVSAVRKPGIDSSLSRVPPVCPSDRPDIMGTGTPHAATSGARQREILSPTPPVECLSTLMPGIPPSRRRSPEVTIASSQVASSRSERPRHTMAISRAESW